MIEAPSTPARISRCETAPNAIAARTAIAVLVVLACVVRLVHLDADPVFPTWVGYIVDEGRWSESARNLALFGNLDAFAERIHLLLSPAYQICSFLAFKLHGVNFVSARMLPALAGCALVLVVVLCLRRCVTLYALAVGVVILGFETNMLVESRMALPEIPAALATLVSALILLLARQTRWNAVLAGLVFTLAMGMKATVAFSAPALLAMALMPSEQLTWRARVARMLAFAATLGAVVAIALLGGLATHVLPLGNLQSLGSRLLTFINVAPARDAVWSIFESQGHAMRNVLLLGAWCGSWIWWHRAPGPVSQAGRLYLATALWAGWSLLVWVINAYSPGRYVVHLIVPATLNLMFGLSVGDRQTPARIEDRFKRSAGLARSAWLAWLVLPAAIIAASLLVGLAGLWGLEITRISDRTALAAMFTLAFGLLAHRAGAGRRTAAAFVLAPIIATLMWCQGWEFELFRHFWEHESGSATLLWVLAGVVALAAGASLGRFGIAARHVVAVQLGLLILAASPIIFRATLALRAPTFTIRDASRDLGQLLPASATGLIGVGFAASLFLENGLRYVELSGEERDLQWFVIFDFYPPHLRKRSFGSQTLDRVRTYTFNIDSRFRYDSRLRGPLQAALMRWPQSQPASAPGDGAR